jgi:hypothetical protein
MAKVSATIEDLDEGNATAKATNFMAGETFTKGGTLVINWDVKEVANWLISIDFKEVVPLFQESNVSGAVLAKLNDRLLKEIGIHNVGTRVELMNEIVKVQAIARSEWRNHVLWASMQYRPGCCNNYFPLGFPFFCCCVEFMYGKPDTYTLTNSRLNILFSENNCPLFGSCCGTAIKSNNVDLTMVIDIDSTAATNLVGNPKGSVVLSTMDGKMYSLDLESSECQKVTAIMNNAKEEAGIIAGMHAMSMLR